MFSKILVPVDGSEPSNAAVSLAVRMAKESKAVLVFVHAVELNKVVAMAGPSAIDPSFAIDAACKAGEEILSQAKAVADAASVPATCEQPEDDSVASVLDSARRNKAELIAMGSHGRSGVARLFLGSVAEGILRQARIPVLICHAPAKTQSSGASSRGGQNSG
jgi:nucleotide-binding universal stress UspA family protein